MIQLPPYRASPVKRQRRSEALVEQLERQIFEVLAADRPQSVRHVFYRKTDPRLPKPVEMSEQGYRQLQERIVKMRWSGVLTYGWITDATRRGHLTATFSGTGDFLRQVRGLYRADLWQYSDYCCEVWTESRSIADVIQSDCNELAVSLYPDPGGGFTSISLVYQAAEYINSCRDRKPVLIIYIGGYDPAGVLIDMALEWELREHLRSDVEMVFQRVAITPGQIEAYGLPGKPRKETDRRALHIHETVEAEAMPAHILRRLLRSQIEGLLPEGALAAAKAAEESEMCHLERLADLAQGRTS